MVNPKQLITNKRDITLAMALIDNPPLTFSQISSVLMRLFPDEKKYGYSQYIKGIIHRAKQRGIIFPPRTNSLVNQKTSQKEPIMSLNTKRAKRTIILLLLKNPALSYLEIHKRNGERRRYIRMVAVDLRKTGFNVPPRPRSNWSGIAQS